MIFVLSKNKNHISVWKMAVFLFLLGTKIKNLICIKKMAVIFYFGFRKKQFIQTYHFLMSGTKKIIQTYLIFCNAFQNKACLIISLIFVQSESDLKLSWREQSQAKNLSTPLPFCPRQWYLVEDIVQQHLLWSVRDYHWCCFGDAWPFLPQQFFVIYGQAAFLSFPYSKCVIVSLSYLCSQLSCNAAKYFAILTGSMQLYRTVDVPLRLTVDVSSG